MRVRLGWVVCLMAGFTCELFGQKDELDAGFGIFNNKREYAEFMGSAKKLAYGENGNKELQAMIPMINDIVLNKPIGSTAGTYKTQASPIGMLANKSIRAEIDMVDEQYEELKTVSARIQERVASEIRGLDFSNTATVTTRIKGIRDRAKKELDELLLPHQVKRLNQLQLRSRMRYQSLSELLSEDPIKSELDLSDDQTAMLKKEEKKIEAELQEEIQKLRESARQKLLSKLKPEQEDKVTELLGDAFRFKGSDKREKEAKIKPKKVLKK